MSGTNFLEVDESIKTRNLILHDKNEAALDQQMNELMKQFDSKPSIVVQPIPGICVKTRTTSKEKVFVNICISDKIPPPKDISLDKLLELINEEASDYTIPMSIGAERMEADKSGVLSATYDVMINSAYLKKCQEKEHFMSFTILVILEGIANKFNKKLLLENYVILKNRMVMGKLQQHRIEDREPKKLQSQKPLIEEISHSTTSTNIKTNLQDNNTANKGYIILKQPSKGPAERLIALFDMPKSVSIEDIVVLINSDRINVTDEKVCCSYDVLLPYILKADSAKAFLDYNIGVLRIDILIEQK